MQFTPQQLAGAQRYGSKTRIGNWAEDVHLEETKIAEFRQLKQSGMLKMGFRQSKLTTCNQTVPHSFSADGLLRFGDSIMLSHPMSGGTLACDLWEESGPNEFVVTVSQQSAPVARNTFTIVRVTERLQDPVEYVDSSVLHYGEPFILQCSDSMLVDPGMDMLRPPLYLGSAPKTHEKGARISNRQAMFMTPILDSSAVWIVQKVSPDEDTGITRLLSAGEAVPANAPIVVRHRGTSQALFCDPAVVDSTEFGPEFEACCYNSHASGKRECLVAESKGMKTASTLGRKELDQNLWQFATASVPEAAEDKRSLPPPLSLSSVIGKVKAIVDPEQFKSAFSTSTKMARFDATHIIGEVCSEMHPDQIAVLVDAFDRGDGLVDVASLVATISA